MTIRSAQPCPKLLLVNFIIRQPYACCRLIPLEKAFAQRKSCFDCSGELEVLCIIGVHVRHMQKKE